ncbi:restriction endonuclease subunit S [Vibrio cholerae]|uniref:restriction endonuclease subunit S n=1 Tax=Vibrio TaxID=662 RepID=UPI000D20D02A|nr:MULTISPECIES: restriction endonuclease subunit S [Vibrio]EGR1349226.1 restriction endonuclease subunit S [Vibrio cholerae]EGR2472160.1 restriction endonuclease subunit S [Vibrio cholerae]EGR4129670.1 restriction endonuclease subunit S [Vibrio cholerae]EKF9294822.1 restriction endonuclease subunit S [Vibrio cholerae]MCO7016835.1 restriction endonuclease subunit S [Vibrio paracholerae]
MNNLNSKPIIPELRFGDFYSSEQWKIRPLGKCVSRIVTKNEENNQNSLTISSKLGLVSQLDYFNKKISADNLSGYYLLHKGDFAYNKSYSQGYPMGAIKRLKDYDKGVVSTLYICFRAKDGYDGSFLEQYFDSGLLNSEIAKIAQEGGRAHGLLNIGVKEFFSEVNIVLPEINEQIKIAKFLSSIDKLVSENIKKLESLMSHQKGLLQKLFPDEGKSEPEFNFTCNVKWNKKTFEEVYSLKTTNSLSRDKLNYDDGLVKNIHYGDVHTKFSTLFDITKEYVPFINAEIALDKVKEESYCQEGDMVFADASEDIDDVGKSIELINLNGEKLLSGLHTILARQKGSYLVKGFGGYLFKSEVMRKQIQKESQGAKVLGISAARISKIDVVYPIKQSEQQRIVDCLSSLDELIDAQTKKIEILNIYKKGLMQQLFPEVKESIA